MARRKRKRTCGDRKFERAGTDQEQALDGWCSSSTGGGRVTAKSLLVWSGSQRARRRKDERTVRSISQHATSGLRLRAAVAYGLIARRSQLPWRSFFIAHQGLSVISERDILPAKPTWAREDSRIYFASHRWPRVRSIWGWGRGAHFILQRLEQVLKRVTHPEALAAPTVTTEILGGSSADPDINVPEWSQLSDHEFSKSYLC